MTYQHMREFLGYENDNGTTEIKTSNLPVIKLKINNNNLNTLIDTGSELSIINEQLYNKKLANGKRNYIRISKINLITASGKRFAECNKVVNTEFMIGNQLYRGNFVLIVDIQYDVILGEDILTENKAKIDLEDRFMIFKGIKVPIMKSKDLIDVNFDRGERAKYSNEANVPV